MAFLSSGKQMVNHTDYYQNREYCLRKEKDTEIIKTLGISNSPCDYQNKHMIDFCLNREPEDDSSKCHVESDETLKTTSNKLSEELMNL